MKFGPNVFYKCPHCNAVLKSRTLMSGNGLRAKFYSDGRRNAPMLPDLPDLTSCYACASIFWLSDLKPLKAKGDSRDVAPRFVEHLPFDGLWKALALHLMLAHDGRNWRKRHIYIRQRIWWWYNIHGFEDVSAMDKWFQNCLSLLDLLDLTNEHEAYMYAEILRNTCNFADAERILKTLPNKRSNFREYLLEECVAGNPRTIQLNRLKKRIEVEEQYDVLENSKKDILFCIGEHAGEPEDPELVYAGDAHALLYRRKDEIVVLDFVHEDVRKQLAKKEEVLFAEFMRVEQGAETESKTRVVREYAVPVNVYGQLPDEWGLYAALPDDESLYDLPGKLPDDPQQAKEMIEEYRRRAMACDATAQYALWKLYMTERYYDGKEAMRWLMYAARQGVKSAVDDLMQIEENEDEPLSTDEGF